VAWNKKKGGGRARYAYFFWLDIPQLLVIVFAVILSPYMQTHFTPTFLPPTPLYLIAISPLAINCLSPRARLGSSQPSLRTQLPFTCTQTTPLTPANTQPSHALAKYTKKPWLLPPSFPPLLYFFPNCDSRQKKLSAYKNDVRRKTL